MTLRVRLLGGLSVDGVLERELGSRKGRTVLKVLALARGQAVSADAMAEVLWGDEQPARPAEQVGVLVSRLRGVLGAGHITRSDAGFALHADWVDIDEVDRLTAGAADALASGRIGAARAAAGAAVTLAIGPLLPGDEGAWVESHRASVAGSLARAHRVAVDAALAAGDVDGAATLADRALGADPYDEVLLRSLMQAHLAAGRPASALAAYARVRHRLVEDLGVSPSRATEDIHGLALAAADGDDSDAAARSPVAARFRDRDQPFAGREAELAALDAALDALSTAADATAGHRPRVIAVEGEAGIGKTALVETWMGRSVGRAVFLRGRCDELGRDLPLQPLTDALARHLTMIGAEGAGAALGADAAELASVLGVLAGGAGYADTRQATTVIDAEAARARLFGALLNVVERLEPLRPAVIIIEDFQLAGPTTRSWLAFASQRATRTLLVVTARPGALAGQEVSTLINLGPLDVDAVSSLGGAERATRLFERTGGHPLLVAALLDLEDDSLPASLAEAVAVRADSLGVDAGTTLRTAAVLGIECDLELVAHVLDRPVLVVLEELERAAQAGLLVDRGGGFEFRHDLVREALVLSTGAARRALVHRRAAEALARRSAPDPLAVAIHARAGGAEELASTWLVVAAQAAADRHDLDVADEHLAAALALRPSAAIHTARARVLMRRGALEDAAEEVAVALRSAGAGAAALEAAGWIAYYRRRYEEAQELADLAVAAVQPGDEAIAISAQTLAGRVRHSSGDLAGAAGRLAAIGDGPPSVRGVADVFLAQTRIHQGRPIDALAALAGPALAPDLLAHHTARMHLRLARAMSLGQLGRHAEALACARELVRVATEIDEPRFVAIGANATGWLLRNIGDFGQADEQNVAAMEATGGEARPPADHVREPFYVALLDLADGAARAHDWAALEARLASLATVDDWRGSMWWHQHHRLGLVRAHAALGRGDSEEAASLALSVAVDAAARGAARYEAFARLLAGVADPKISDAELDPFIGVAGRCAVIDGWPLVASLAAGRDVARWRVEAERMASQVVSSAADLAGAAGRYVERTFADVDRSTPR